MWLQFLFNNQPQNINWSYLLIIKNELQNEPIYVYIFNVYAGLVCQVWNKYSGIKKWSVWAHHDSSRYLRPFCACACPSLGVLFGCPESRLNLLSLRDADLTRLRRSGLGLQHFTLSPTSTNQLSRACKSTDLNCLATVCSLPHAISATQSAIYWNRFIHNFFSNCFTKLTIARSHSRWSNLVTFSLSIDYLHS